MTDTDKLDAFTRAYIECALFSSTAYGVPEAAGDESFDTSMESYGLGVDDFAPETLAKMIEDCRQFQEENETLYSTGWTDEQAGHDFWLTRNGHGAGFWDRGCANGKALTDAAHFYGSVDLYIGDDGEIHS